MSNCPVGLECRSSVHHFESLTTLEPNIGVVHRFHLSYLRDSDYEVSRVRTLGPVGDPYCPPGWAKRHYGRVGRTLGDEGFVPSRICHVEPVWSYLTYPREERRPTGHAKQEDVEVPSLLVRPLSSESLLREMRSIPHSQKSGGSGHRVLDPGWYCLSISHRKVSPGVY